MYNSCTLQFICPKRTYYFQYTFINFSLCHCIFLPPSHGKKKFPLASVFINTGHRLIVLLSLCCQVQHGPSTAKTSPPSLMSCDALPPYLVFQGTSGFIVNTHFLLRECVCRAACCACAYPRAYACYACTVNAHELMNCMHPSLLCCFVPGLQ